MNSSNHEMRDCAEDARKFLQRDDDLAEMLRALHVAQRIGGLLKGEDAIDHGTQLIGGDGAVHVFEHGNRSDKDAAHAEGLNDR